MRGILILLLAILLSPTPTAPAEDFEGFFYEFTVLETGYIEIDMKFNTTSATETWLMLPIYKNYTETFEGEVEELNSSRFGPFYENVSFRLGARSSMEFNWSYRFGALIVEPTGVFFSTMIGFDTSKDAVVVVRIPESFSINRTFLNQEELPPDELIEEDGFNVLVYRLPKVEVPGLPPPSTYRVMVTFQTAEEPDIVEVSSGSFRVLVPRRYEDLAENVTHMYSEYRSYLEDLMGLSEVPVDVRFFVPSDPEEIFTLGMTPAGPPFVPRDEEIEPRNISLNLMLVRMVEEELPNTLLHELLHQYMLASGLSVDLRWAHEGLAQYLSIEIMREKTGNGSLFEEEYEKADVVAQAHMWRMGYLLAWVGGGIPENSADLYYGSLYVFKKFADEFGGIEVYKKFFREISSWGEPVDDLGDLVEGLSRAAGRDVSEFFRSLGFPVPRLGRRVGDLISRARAISEATAPVNPLSGLVEEWVEQSERALREGRVGDASELAGGAFALSFFGPIVASSIVAGFLAAVYSAASSSRQTPSYPPAPEEPSTSPQTYPPAEPLPHRSGERTSSGA